MDKPIGVFDSGYGGLTVLKEIVKKLPDYDYIYFGDNARAPYGIRSFETVYRYTLEAVTMLFRFGCHLIILACNTASAKALRSIQQYDLPHIDPAKRVLGVIRPTVEIIDTVTRTGHVGIMGTDGTVASNSYLIEIRKLFPGIVVHQQACPLLVPLVESEEIANPGTDYFVEKYISLLLKKDSQIDTIILGCTHYPLLLDSIKKYAGSGVAVIAQDSIVADSLDNYLKRHPEMERNCSRGRTRRFYTTDSNELFDRRAELFFRQKITSEMITL